MVFSCFLQFLLTKFYISMDILNIVLNGICNKDNLISYQCATVLLCGKATEYIFQFSGDLVVWVYFDGTCMPDQIQGRCLPDP